MLYLLFAAAFCGALYGLIEFVVNGRVAQRDLKQRNDQKLAQNRLNLKTFRGETRTDEEVKRQLNFDARLYSRGLGAEEGTYYERFPGQLPPKYCEHFRPLHYMLLVPGENTPEENFLRMLDETIGLTIDQLKSMPDDPECVAGLAALRKLEGFPPEFWISYESEFASLLTKALPTNDLDKVGFWIIELSGEYANPSPLSA